MKPQKQGEEILKYKFIFTAIVLVGYIVGKGIPLYMIDLSAYVHKTMDAEGFLLQTMSGDTLQCSIFALGVSPYMLGSMMVQLLSAFRSSEVRAKLSPVKTGKMTLNVTLFIAFIQAILCVGNLKYRVTGRLLLLAQVVSVFELVAGAMIIVWLCTRNKKYGIGGQTALIYVNILDGICSTILRGNIQNLWLPLCNSILVMLLIIFMENTEKHIPLQRISIHNIYGDKNYLAIKLNPIGVMPAMFSMAFFMVPQMLVELLLFFFPNQEVLLWFQENISLNRPFGIGVYIGVLYVLTIVFSRVFINPKELTEQFLKSGDSIVGVHAGKDTRRYLSRVITRLSLYSASAMSLCLGLPMVMQLYGGDNGSMTLPSSVMMLTGIWCNLYREVEAIEDLEGYKPFI